MADRIVDHGLTVATLSAETKQRVTATTSQDFPTNPMDAGDWKDFDTDYGDIVKTLQAFEDDPAIGVTLYSELLFIGMEKILPGLAAFHQTCKKPHITSIQSTPFAATFSKALRDSGGMVAETPERSLDAFRILYAHAHMMAGDRVPPPPKRQASPLLNDASTGLLSADGARLLLAAYGIPFVHEADVAHVGDLSDAAEKIGYPLVLKGEVSGIAHKTEAGLVHSHINHATELLDKAQGMNPMPERYYLQQRIDDAIEILVGARIDVNVGAVVVLNFGGIYSEAMGTPIVEFAPFDEAVARDMINRLDPKGILDGYRTGHKKSVGSLATLLVRFSHLLYHNSHRLAEIDLNPVMVSETSAVAVDVIAAVRAVDAEA